MKPIALASFRLLEKELSSFAVKLRFENDHLYFVHGDQCICLHLIAEEPLLQTKQGIDLLPMDYLVKEPIKLAALVRSRLSLNTTVFARHCELQKIEKPIASHFLNTYHLMHATQSAFNFGLVYKQELLCLASFSKGRKMRRLPDALRSFELIRFCCKRGYTVTGGLSRLVKNFILEKNAGDVMTYVDKQLFEGHSFIRSGFKKVGETDPAYFLVDKMTFEKTLLKNPDELYDSSVFYRTRNLGNIKLVYTPDGRI